MRTFLFRRMVLTIPVLFIMTIMVFAILHLTPGDPARIMLGPEARVEDVQALRHNLGLDKPLVTQYLLYLGRLLRGDLGESIKNRRPVTELIAERLPVTLTLALVSMLLAVVVAIPLGVLAAVKRGRVADYVSMWLALVGVSTPTFWVALMLIFVFSYRWRILPATGWANPLSDGMYTFVRHLAMPTVTLALGMTALIARLVRASMIEILGEDFIRTARAKGLSSKRVIFGHALKNALIPAITIVGLQLGPLVGGAVVTETVFGLPGIGRLAVDAIQSRDFPLLQGIIFLIAVAVTLANLLVDIAYAMVDPRISVNE